MQPETKTAADEDAGFPCKRTKIAMDSSWSNAPLDIVHLLAKRMTGNLSDLVRLSAVCSSWRCLLLDSQWLGFARQMEALIGVPSLHLPKLMLPEKTDPDGRDFIDWRMRQPFQLHLPEVQGRLCCGSGHGWLVTVGVDMDIHLLNPMTREQVQLPSDPLFKKADLGQPDNFMRKAIIIGNPSESGDCTVVAIIFSNLFLVKPGHDEGWTRERSHYFLTDIAHSQGLLYGLSSHFVECWSMNPVEMLWVSVWNCPMPEHILESYSDFKSYFLEVSGEVIGVSRPLQSGDDSALGNGSLVVFRLTDGDDKEWVEVKDLGDCCLFLGENTSIALSPVPPSSGFRRNCIYFTHGRYIEVECGWYDMSIYSLEDGTYKPFFVPGSVPLPPFPSLWVTFNPCIGKIN